MASLDSFHVKSHGWDRATYPAFESATKQSSHTISNGNDAHSMVNSPPCPATISKMMDEQDETTYGEHSQKGCFTRILQSYHGYVEFSCPVPANTMVSTSPLDYIISTPKAPGLKGWRRAQPWAHHALFRGYGALTRTSAKASHKSS